MVYNTYGKNYHCGQPQPALQPVIPTTTTNAINRTKSFFAFFIVFTFLATKLIFFY